jgi:hypothetical protein
MLRTGPNPNLSLGGPVATRRTNVDSRLALAGPGPVGGVVKAPAPHRPMAPRENKKAAWITGGYRGISGRSSRVAGNRFALPWCDEDSRRLPNTVSPHAQRGVNDEAVLFLDRAHRALLLLGGSLPVMCFRKRP